MRFPSAAPFHPPGLAQLGRHSLERRTERPYLLRAPGRRPARATSSERCASHPRPRSRARAAGPAPLHPLLPCYSPFRPQQRAAFCGRVCRSGRGLPPLRDRRASLCPAFASQLCCLASVSATACRRRRWRHRLRAPPPPPAPRRPSSRTPREVALLGPYLELRDVRCDSAGHFSPAQLLESTIYVVDHHINMV